MALFTWNDSMKTNITECDDQHKKLVKMLNDIHDAMLTGKGKEVLRTILSDLVSYTVYHFGTEEKLFQKYGYPDQVNHKQEHDDLAKKAGDLKKKVDAGENITIDVLNFLRDWLKTHIAGSDKKYGLFLSGKGVA